MVRMGKMYFGITFLVAFAACCVPGYRQEVGDEVFNALMDKVKRQVQEYPDSSLMVLHELLPQQDGEEKALNRGRVLHLTGIAYDMKGMYDSAAYYLYEASRLAEEINSDSLQVVVFSNLGILQYEMRNPEEALNYYRQALAIAEKQKDSVKMANQLNNIGNVYLSLTKEYGKAIPYLEQCVEIGRKIGYSGAGRVAGINLAMIYLEAQEPDRAIREAETLIDLFGPNTYADFTIAQALKQKHQYKDAIPIYQDLLKRALDTKEFELEILKELADCYQSAHELDRAMDYLARYHAKKDSLHNLATDKTIYDLKIMYETEKKETEIAGLKKEKHLVTGIGIIAVALLLSLVCILFALYWYMRGKKLFAEQRAAKLEQEKQLIASQALLDGEAQERTRLARDLHDGLGGYLTGVRLKLNEMKRGGLIIEDDDVGSFEMVLNLLDTSIRELRRIAHNMMPESLSRFGLKVALTDFCRSTSYVEFGWFGDETRLSRQIEVIAYRIILELVNNALKHSGASHILVHVVQNTDRLALTVDDNGCGFDTSAKASGTGIDNIRTRVASAGGTIDVYSKTGQGTEVNIEFKL